VNGYTNGAYIVNLKLAYQIPEYLPMWGKKVRIYYHGISSFCTNCYDIGHPRNECKAKSSTWKDYIDHLVGSGIPSRIFGCWLTSNLSITRENEKNVPQPKLNADTVDSEDSDDYDIDNIPPKMLKLFKKLQASTPKSMSKSSIQKAKKSEKKDSSAKGRGSNKGRGRGASSSRGRGKN
jgi:hypothetical protein